MTVKSQQASQSTVTDKVKNRLEQLDDFEEVEGMTNTQFGDMGVKRVFIVGLRLGLGLGLGLG